MEDTAMIGFSVHIHDKVTRTFAYYVSPQSVRELFGDVCRWSDGGYFDCYECSVKVVRDFCENYDERLALRCEAEYYSGGWFNPQKLLDKLTGLDEAALVYLKEQKNSQSEFSVSIDNYKDCKTFGRWFSDFNHCSCRQVMSILGGGCVWSESNGGYPNRYLYPVKIVRAFCKGYDKRMGLGKTWRSSLGPFDPQELLNALDGLDDEAQIYFEEWDES
jgi:hypothetical protein